MDFRIVSIGVSRYDDSSIGGLAPCDGEAKEIFDLLCDPAGGTCKVAESVWLSSTGGAGAASDRATILSHVHNVANQTAPDEGMIVYFSGHGSDHAGTSYLVCRDTRRSLTSDTGIAVKTLLEVLHSSPARFKIVILDCCKPGFLLGKDADSGMSEEFQKTIDHLPRELQDEGLIVLASCKAHQVSNILKDGSRSVFTHFLVEGLRAGKSSLQELYEYTVEKVRGWSLQNGVQQVPNIASQITGSMSSILLARDGTRTMQQRPAPVTAAGSPKATPTLEVVRLQGTNKLDYPKKPILHTPAGGSWTMVSLPPQLAGHEVDHDGAQDVRKAAEKEAERIDGTIGAILLRCYSADDLKPGEDDATDFPTGSYKVGTNSTEWYVEVNARFYSEPGLPGEIREATRRAWRWERAVFEITVAAPHSRLAGVVAHIKALDLGKHIKGYVRNDYLEIALPAVGTRGRPAAVRFEEAEDKDTLFVGFDLSTVASEATLDVLWRVVADLLEGKGGQDAERPGPPTVSAPR